MFFHVFHWGTLTLAAATAVVAPAQATTQLVSFNTVNASTTVPFPFAVGDVLRLDSHSSQVGALLQPITFPVGAGVGSLSGQASWEIDTATGTGPRLMGVDIDVVDAVNALVVSNTCGLAGNGFASSAFLTAALSHGTCRLVAAGTGVRDSSLDVALKFAAAVPRPGTYGLMSGGLGRVRWLPMTDYQQSAADGTQRVLSPTIVKSHVSDDGARTALCAVVPSPEVPRDWMRMWAVTLANVARGRAHPALNAWLLTCRLNGQPVMARGVTPDDSARTALLQETGAKAGEAAARLPALPDMPS